MRTAAVPTNAAFSGGYGSRRIRIRFGPGVCKCISPSALRGPGTATRTGAVSPLARSRAWRFRKTSGPAFPPAFRKDILPACTRNPDAEGSASPETITARSKNDCGYGRLLQCKPLWARLSPAHELHPNRIQKSAISRLASHSTLHILFASQIRVGQALGLRRLLKPPVGVICRTAGSVAALVLAMSDLR